MELVFILNYKKKGDEMRRKNLLDLLNKSNLARNVLQFLFE